MKEYHINIFYSEEDGAISPISPTSKHVRPSGKTPEDALREVERAKAAWIEAAKEAGKPIPPPRYRPVIYQVGR